jgi:hypothetical protein
MISLRAGASFAASAMVPARSAVTKQSFASEFSRMKANSLACSLAFIGTAQRPACQMAYMTSSVSTQFVIAIATRSPLASPKRPPRCVLITETLRQKSR